jgi:hypothetical protein
VSANTHKDFALEILMTMAPILDEGVQSLSFRLERIQQVVPYEYIRELPEKPTNNAIPSATPLSMYSPLGCARGLWGG